MKHTKVLAAIAMMSAFFSFGLTAASRSKGQAKATKQSYKLVLDFPGIEEGSGYPKWVSAALKGNTAEISKALKLEDDRQVFWFTNKGPDLDFLQHWTDTVDMQAEIATAMSRIVERNAQALYQGGTAETQKALADLIKIGSKVRLSGMVKEASFWVKYAAPKNPNQKIKKDLSNADIYYTYFVVYSMDKDAWGKQVNAALGDPELNAKVSEYMLKNASGLGITEDQADSKTLVKAVAKEAKQPVTSSEETADEADYSWLDEE